MKIWLILSILLLNSLAFGFVSIKPCLGLAEDVKVGLFYYAWYNGTSGQGHWNGTPEGDPNSTKWTVIDEPVLGFYNSSDPKTIKQHLDWFKLVGINFLIVSWWGMHPYDYGQQAPVDDAVKALYKVTDSSNSNIKIALMVEGFNESADNYDFDYIRNYVKTTYYDVYPNLTLRIDNLPLLCWWNSENMTGTMDKPRPERVAQIHNDSLFENRIIGHNNYVDWYAWTPSTVNSSEDPVLSKDGFTAIEPRYDYSQIDSSYTPYDPAYSYLYDNQWKQVANWTHAQSVKYVAIYSWNEYHERSQIEPHSTDQSIILTPFVETFHNIVPEFPSLLILPLFFTTSLLAVTFYKRRRKAT